jgi:hypothetical protein
LDMWVLMCAAQFKYTGTRDMTAHLSMADAHAFYCDLAGVDARGPSALRGNNRVMKYLHDLAVFAVCRALSYIDLSCFRVSTLCRFGRLSSCALCTCVARWSMSACQQVGQEMFDAALICVDDAVVGLKLQKVLYERYGMYMIVLPAYGQVWTRLSAQVSLNTFSLT